MRPPRHLAAAAMRRLLSPVVPASKRLPFSYWVRRFSGECGPDLTRVDRFFADTGVAVDVGANEGLFTYRLSKVFRHVHAFEINPELAMPIAQFNSGNVTLHPFGLSSSDGSMKLNIPVAHGFLATGWGSLEHNVFPNSDFVIQKDVQVRLLDDFNLTGVDFIKIDVEGHELEVLKGAVSTVQKYRPVLLIEVQDKNLPAANLWFQELGFWHGSIKEIFRLQRADSNHLFVPQEKLDQLRLEAKH